MNAWHDAPREECGIIGVFAPNEDVARMTFFGLFALQHRGQEAAGIAVADGQTISLYKNVGLVSQVFRAGTLDELRGHYAIGHTRYSTTGSSLLRNAQPFLIETMNGPLALAHNGNLVNSAELRAELMRQGVGFSSSSDSEVMTMMLARDAGPTWEARIKEAMKKWVGAYSLAILTRDCVYAVRDPWGFRPLAVGMLPSGGYAVASETGALRTLGCEAIRDVQPGEIVTLSDKALTITQALPPVNPSARCVFEFIYFARPDQTWEGVNVHAVRQRLGEELAKEWKANVSTTNAADVVIPVPDSSIPAAIGFSRVSGIPYNDGFVKNRYVGRTFIEPTDSLRKRGVGMKFNVIIENVLGKRVIVIDDSIVRGNTTGPLIRLLRQAGAKEVHVCITCPPIKHPCFMGVDMGTYDDLIAHKRTVDEIREEVGADSLTFLSLDGMMRAVGSAEGYCQACFTGQYPVPVDLSSAKTGFELPIIEKRGKKEQ
ncbi:MAG: amidophosphoribosyltransferase [Anaerolineales bacterium]|nr:amidophosphoribosyltransferase [Anaerolineales bacterium]MCX7755988.1 amidophosphoribosyltransferase [Anaerolineales bacterium]MDW8277068.1 amidophosphoribosyltransferase [Anaerolineales bacterium]